MVTSKPPFLEYYEQIQSGKIRASKKIIKTYKKIVHDYYNEESSYVYSPERANHVIHFIEKYCCHSKGKWGGKPIRLELWEKAALTASFGFVDKFTGFRKYREVILIVARKNGKSLLASAVALYLMIGTNEPGAEVYAVATKKDQAKVIWSEAKRMVSKSPQLRALIKRRVADMECLKNDSVFKPLGSDSETLDGLNVYGAALDEIHAWVKKNLYDVIVDGTTARDEPMIFITTTAGTVRENVYDEKYEEIEDIINGYDDPNGYQDEHTIAFVYELDDRKEIEDPENWGKANPGLGTIKNKQALADKVKKAKHNPKLLKNLLCKDFNIRETSGAAWMSFDEIDNKKTFSFEALKPRYCIVGLDLSQTTDLTAACCLFKVAGDETIYCEHMYWLPEDTLEKHINEDHIPYDKWLDLGLLRTTPGNRIDYRFIVDWIKEIQFEKDCYVYKVMYDSYSAQYLVTEIENTFGKIAEAVHQGVKTLSGPMYAMGADLSAKKINYNNNPITKWCLTNTAIVTDKNGNIQPIKTNQRRRIDGTAAMLDSYVGLEWHLDEYNAMI